MRKAAPTFLNVLMRLPLRGGDGGALMGIKITKRVTMNKAIPNVMNGEINAKR